METERRFALAELETGTVFLVEILGETATHVEVRGSFILPELTWTACVPQNMVRNRIIKESKVRFAGLIP